MYTTIQYLLQRHLSVSGIHTHSHWQLVEYGMTSFMKDAIIFNIEFIKQWDTNYKSFELRKSRVHHKVHDVGKMVLLCANRICSTITLPVTAKKKSNYLLHFVSARFCRLTSLTVFCFWTLNAEFDMKIKICGKVFWDLCSQIWLQFSKSQPDLSNYSSDRI